MSASVDTHELEVKVKDMYRHVADEPHGDYHFELGVINLVPQKERVFAEAARVLRPGGRLAIADIVSEQQLKESIVCDADLWASCIGGAARQDAYRMAIESSGFLIDEIRVNPYAFISDRARNASEKYRVKSVSLLAHKP